MNKINDFDCSFLHPDLMHSLFDSGDIFSVKKIFNQLDTRIYTSFISNAPYSLLSQSAKENLDKLQYLHGYSLIESPAFQRQEFFKITSPIDQSPQIHLPDYNLFIILVKLLYSTDIEFSFVQLFAQFNISSSVCKQLIKQHYLSKKGRLYMLTDKSLQLKKYINNYLAFQPNLTLEENDFLIKISNPETYNVFKLKDFSFSENIERICTRLLAQSLFTQSFYSFTSFLLYYFIQFKQHIITDKQLSQLLVVALQINTESSPAQPIPVIPDTIPTGQESSMQDYYNEIKDVIQVTDQNQTVKLHTPQITDPPTQSKLDKISQLSKNNSSTILTNLDSFPAIKAKLSVINDHIHKELTDKNIIFPQRPFFFIAKFLKPDTIDLLYQDLSELNNLTGDMNKLEVS